MKNLFKIVALITIWLMTIQLQAQVTIGLDDKPVEGALLQLKDGDYGNGVNSQRGLGLPRVELSDLTKLKIGNEDELTGTLREAHIGLVVYNVAENFCDVPYIGKGVYVWDGEQWQYVGSSSSIITGSSEVKVFVDDRDDQEYLYRTFGTNGGTWMLENMRALTYTDGSTAPTLTYSGTHDKMYAYPSVVSTGLDDTNYKAQPVTGLLYSWAAAMNIDDAKSITDNQGEGNSAEQAKGPQGICPTGWHIPSDKEWNALEKEIADHPELYSTNSGTEAAGYWQTSWATTNSSGFRPGTSIPPGHGESMISTCNPVNSPENPLYYGKSFPRQYGGFDVLLVGNISGLANNGYGRNSTIWTASAYSDELKWYRGFTSQWVGVSKAYGNYGNRMSVRCVMD